MTIALEGMRWALRVPEIVRKHARPSVRTKSQAAVAPEAAVTASPALFMMNPMANVSRYTNVLWIYSETKYSAAGNLHKSKAAQSMKLEYTLVQ